MSYISSATTVAYINSTPGAKTVFLPSSFNIEGKQIFIKDFKGAAGINPITIATLGGDLFENGTSNLQITQNSGSLSLVAHKGKWYTLGGGINSADYGLSSLSTIVSYGLSSLTALQNPDISSLSSIVSYGL